MIFEIIGAIDFRGSKSVLTAADLFLDNVYRSIPNRRVEDTVHGLSVTYMARNDGTEPVCRNEDCYIVCVGEPRSRSARSERLAGRDILDLFVEYGDDFLQHVKGNFQIILYDLRQNGILLANSRFGVSPFYYSYEHGQLLFSSNMRVIAGIPQDRNDVDMTAIAEYSLFGYPLGNKTLFRPVKSLRPAEKVRVNGDSLKNDVYWDHRSLTNQRAYSADEALDIGMELFRQTVNTYTGEPDRICVSLTGGFDGRTMLSAMDKEPDDYLCYSFGIKGSLNVSIPHQICQYLGLNYLPVWLDAEYERSFDQYALQALEFSDCLATFERANYPYAFRRLSEFSSVVVTGIFGSELMRTFQNISVGYMVTKNYVDLIRADDKVKMLEALISQASNSYYNPAIFRADDNELIEHILGECFDNYAGIPDNERFFLFLLHEGARKYFGGEVHMERIYGTNRFPFLDDDFVEFIFKSPFSGVKSNPLRPSIKERFTSQYFYARIMQKYMPRLLMFSTDHGYPPRYIMSKAALVKIAPCLLLKRLRQTLGRNRDFKTEEWSREFYHKRLFQKPMNRELFSRKLDDDLKTGRWRMNHLEYAKAASLKLYLETLGHA